MDQNFAAEGGDAVSVYYPVLIRMKNRKFASLDFRASREWLLKSAPSAAILNRFCVDPVQRISNGRLCGQAQGAFIGNQRHEAK
jgi:hypothetical protein